MTHRLSRRQLLKYSGLTTVALAGCTGDSGGDGSQATSTQAEMETTPANQTTSTPSVGLAVSDQKTDGRTISIPGATIDGKGWLVVHPQAEGGGPNGKVVLAKKKLTAGTYEDIKLTLDVVTTEEATVYGMLHYDDPADGKFTFPQNGDPSVTKDGSPIVKPFDVTVNSGMNGQTKTVEAVETSFDPKQLSISPGTTVEWINKDSYAHDVTSAAFHEKATDWEMSASLSGSDGNATHTFEKAGIYEYYCTIHGKETMCGVVLVGDVSLDKALPCEGGGGY